MMRTLLIFVLRIAAALAILALAWLAFVSLVLQRADHLDPPGMMRVERAHMTTRPG